MAADSEMKMRFEEKLRELVREKNQNNIFLSDEKYVELVSKIKTIKMSSEQKKPVDYKLLKKYDVLVVGGVEKLICPMSEDTTNVKYFAKLSELYGILAETHARVGHGGRNRIVDFKIHSRCHIWTQRTSLTMRGKFQRNPSRSSYV